LVLQQKQQQHPKQPLSNKGKATAKPFLPLPRISVAKNPVDNAVVVIDRMTIMGNE
jgi:hypothetical protein